MDTGAKFVTFAPIIPIVVILALLFHGPWSPARILGFVLCVSAFSVMTWARLNLGSSFSIAPEARKLVTKVVYSKVRHPVYTFGILFIAGLILYTGKFWFLVILIGLIPIQIARARAEEKVLIAKFGDDYLNYKKTTWL